MSMDFFISILENTSVGTIEIRATDKGVRTIKLVDEASPSNENDVSRQARTELEEYFKGNRSKFNVPLDIKETSEFFKSVWKALQDIPHGHTTTYHSIAKQIGRPDAVRAVGMANACNPIPIIIPCHRVVGSDGSLTGYAYGIEKKKELLMLEDPIGHGIQTGLFN